MKRIAVALAALWFTPGLMTNPAAAEDYETVEAFLTGSWEQFDFDGSSFANPFGQADCNAEAIARKPGGGMMSVRGLYTFFATPEGFAVAEQGADMSFMGAETLVEVLDYETTVIPAGGMVINSTGLLSGKIIAPMQGRDDQGRRAFQAEPQNGEGPTLYFISCL